MIDRALIKTVAHRIYEWRVEWGIEQEKEEDWHMAVDFVRNWKEEYVRGDKELVWVWLEEIKFGGH